MKLLHRHGAALRTTPRSAAPRSGWRSAAMGLLLGGVLAGVLFAPARWLALAVASATQGRVLLPQARGTVWQGQAALVLTGGEGSQDQLALPQGLAWRLRPGWQNGPVVRLHLNAPCCTPDAVTATLQPGWSRWQLRVDNHRSHWPAGLLVGLGTPWNTLQLQAQVQLSTTGLQLATENGRLTVSGQAALDLLDASTRLSTLQPMGSYRLQWQGGPDGGTLVMSTLQGALELQGRGQWLAGRLRFEGHAQAAPGREEALANLLNLLGRRQGPRTLIKIG